MHFETINDSCLQAAEAVEEYSCPKQSREPIKQTQSKLRDNEVSMKTLLPVLDEEVFRSLYMFIVCDDISSDSCIINR